MMQHLKLSSVAMKLLSLESQETQVDSQAMGKLFCLGKNQTLILKTTATQSYNNQQDLKIMMYCQKEWF